MISSIHDWVITNDSILIISISFLSFIATTILTFLIIKQTKYVNLKQMQLQELISSKQLEMQKRQILVDSYPYKREIYCYVFGVLELCHYLEELIKSVDLYSKDPNKLREFFQILQEQYVPDSQKALWSMREAEYVLPKNISNVILDVRKNYDSMNAHFITPATIYSVLTPFEMKNKLDDIKKDNINKAIQCCNRIVKHTAFIESIMPIELNISDLSK